MKRYFQKIVCIVKFGMTVVSPNVID